MKRSPCHWFWVCAGETPTSAAICLPVQRWRRRTSTCLTIAGDVGRYRCCGRDELGAELSEHLGYEKGDPPGGVLAASGPIVTYRANPRRPVFLAR